MKITAPEKQQWNSNPWILVGLALLLTAINIGITIGGAGLVVKHHIAATLSDTD